MQETKTRRNSAELTSGILETHPKGYGFLRDVNNQLSRSSSDVFVSESLIQRHRLRPGDDIVVKLARSAKGSGKRRAQMIESINGSVPISRNRLVFEELTAINPHERLILNGQGDSIEMRTIDLICPMGRGQRALIAAPPRAGKTTLLSQLATSLRNNHPESEIKILLIDERPEEVTEVRELDVADVFASSLDSPPESHARLARLVMEHCKRLTESKRDVVLIVDSLTRLARAMNKLPGLSRIAGAGGLNIRALDLPKQLFGAARCSRDGGSLTVIASVLIETQNRMDDVIFQEFKGTGNLDLILDQQLADQRIWPAVDIMQSATRRMELLLSDSELWASTALRRSLIKMPKDQAMRELTQKLRRFTNNQQFLQVIGQTLAGQE